MHVELIRYTPDPEELIAEAYGICTDKLTIPTENIPGLIEKEHLSPIEHPTATFRIEGISRACSHQLVRHRLASFSQRSQRYVTEDDWEPVMPGTVADDGPVPEGRSPTASEVFSAFMDDTKKIYELLRDYGIPDEDARFVLPNATPTEMMMSCNFREWLYIVQLRGTEYAQWEIREVVARVHKQLAEIAPNVFGTVT